ncbi:carbonic anhydrase [Tomitella biformata]|uniref:carbonic anhydrase n=1 Tax=Tomitella biformata TaxID=630403 RepID=UPI000467637C|nr:carbonic anhydrase [Tomitella biformata]
MPNSTPTTAWHALKEGNRRFVSGESIHPSQSIATRNSLVNEQHPTAVIFGCGDSRVAAEITFDQGLGDMFVVRTAGHVIDSSVLGSIEYAVEILDVPLVIVLGHDSCGALSATLDALDQGVVPGGFIRSVVERVIPSVLIGRKEGLTTVDELEGRHVIETGKLLMQRSSIISDRVEKGECAIVGVTYTLTDGCMKLRDVIGDVGEAAI